MAEVPVLLAYQKKTNAGALNTTSGARFYCPHTIGSFTRQVELIFFEDNLLSLITLPYRPRKEKRHSLYYPIG